MYTKGFTLCVHSTWTGVSIAPDRELAKLGSQASGGGSSLMELE